MMGIDRCVQKMWHASKRSVPFFILFSPLFFLLRILECFYRVGFFAVRLFRKTFIKSAHFPVTILSVGNLTVGGTGKSVVVRFLLTQKKYGSCGVVMRGYRGKNEQKKRPLFVGGWGAVCATPEDAGDEAYALAAATNVPVVVCSNKARAAEHLLFLAEKKGQKIDTIIIDDGYQTQSIQKDYEIVLLDARAPFGNGYCLPAGPLREKDLSRADLVVATHADEATQESKNEVIFEIERQRGASFVQDNLVWGVHQYGGIFDAKRKELSPQAIKKKRFCAVSGIGVPEGFRTMLAKNDISNKKMMIFPDHHHYTRADVVRIMKEAGTLDLVTTEKDWVKLSPLLFSEEEASRWYVLTVSFCTSRTTS